MRILDKMDRTYVKAEDDAGVPRDRVPLLAEGETPPPIFH